ncbi:MAG: DUF4097 family beta strand repeat protein [Candidatus Zixiibacteriota bacterium]|nr:MAG: DUF4097 family beta strand repeat protein [candidate division Zixibacteria bacterium]
MAVKALYPLIILMVLAPQASGGSYSFEYQKNIDVPEKSELIIINTSGRIEIKGTPDQVISISALKNVRAADPEEAEEVAEHIEIKVSQSGRRVTVKTRYLKMSGRSRSFWQKLFGSGPDVFGSVDFTITVPQQCAIDVDNTAGDILISGVAGRVQASGTSGSVVMEEIEGDVFLSSISGDIHILNTNGQIDIGAAGSNIELNSVVGSVDIRSTSGDKKGEYISGPVTISQSSGLVDLRYLTGDLRVKSTSGMVYVEQEEGAVDIATHSGKVSVKTELFSDREYFVETTTGSITFLVPETSSGYVRMETVTGEINTELPLSVSSFSRNKLVGSFGGGDSKITLLTSSGDITLGEY